MVTKVVYSHIVNTAQLYTRIFISANGAIINNSIISTDEDPSLRIKSSATINLPGVSTKLNKYIVFTMQTYKKLDYIAYINIAFFTTTISQQRVFI